MLAREAPRSHRRGFESVHRSTREADRSPSLPVREHGTGRTAANGDGAGAFGKLKTVHPVGLPRLATPISPENRIPTPGC
jgi:hypothetical protein